MIKITAVQDPARVEALCRAAGTPYTASTFAYEAEDEGAPAGELVFRIAGETGELLALSSGDGTARLLLVLAALNFLDLAGVETAETPLDDAALLRRTGFRQDDGKWRVNISETFANGCAGEGCSSL